jgi:hypothetical protein
MFQPGHEGGLSFKDNIAVLSHERLSAIQLQLADTTLFDPKFAVWFNSLRNSSAGAWLTVTPAYYKMQLTSDRFSIALRYRYFLHLEHIRSSAKCSCLATLDVQGHHLVSFCRQGNNRNYLHRALVQEFAAISQYCGIWTKTEERGLFRGVDPTCDLRPDVSLIHPPKSSKERLLLDVSVTHPSLRNSNSSAAEIRINQKIAKYLEISNLSGFDFLPVVFESSGSMHRDVILLLQRLAKHASGPRRIPWSTLLAYFEKRLSMAFQNALTGALSSRLLAINARSSCEVISEMEILEC